MNWDQIEGNGQQRKGPVVDEWGELTGDRLTRIDGPRDRLTGTVEEACGLGKAAAERRVRALEDRRPKERAIDQASPTRVIR